MLSPFSIRRPEALADALAWIDDDRVPYWGGTELLLAMRMGLLRPEELIDLKRVPDLAAVRVDGNSLVIGAGATHDEVARHELVLRHAPLLAEAEAQVGNVRVRAQGTIGGNLCFAEPRSDVATVLTALGGSVRLASSDGDRLMSMPEFALGPYWTAREANELLVEVVIPLPSPRGVYLKFQTVERPTVSVAVVRQGTRGARIVLGAVCDVPHVTELSDIHDVDAQALSQQIKPVGDLTGSVRYKRHVTAVYVQRAVARLAAVEGEQ